MLRVVGPDPRPGHADFVCDEGRIEEPVSAVKDVLSALQRHGDSCH
jgi:hypothetical protein